MENKNITAGTAPAIPAATPLEWEVVGLKKGKYMPVDLDGITYDLANLTQEQAVFLLEQGPERMPFLRLKK